MHVYIYNIIDNTFSIGPIHQEAPLQMNQIIMKPSQQLAILQRSLRKANSLIRENDLQGLKLISSQIISSSARSDMSDIQQLRQRTNQLQEMLLANRSKYSQLPANTSRIQFSKQSLNDSRHLQQFMEPKKNIKNTYQTNKIQKSSQVFDFFQIQAQCSLNQSLPIVTQVLIKLTSISLSGLGDFAIIQIFKVQYMGSLKMLLFIKNLKISISFKTQQELNKFDMQLFIIWKKSKVGKGRYFVNQFQNGKDQIQSIQLKKKDFIESKDKFLTQRPTTSKKHMIRQVEYKKFEQQGVRKEVVKQIQDPFSMQLLVPKLFINKSQQVQQLKKQNQLNQSLKKLKSGIKIIKYAKGGLKPKSKLLFLTQNQRQLAWKDPQQQKCQKSVAIVEIVSIIIGRSGEGFKKFDNEKTKKQLSLLSLVIKAKKRTLQIQTENRQSIKVLLQCLEQIVNQNNIPLLVPKISS